MSNRRRGRRRRGGGGQRQEQAGLPEPIEFELHYVVRCSSDQATQGALQAWGENLLRGKKFRGTPVEFVRSAIQEDDDEDEEDEDYDPAEEEEDEEDEDVEEEDEDESEDEEEEEEQPRRRRRRRRRGKDNQGQLSQPQGQPQQQQQQQGQGQGRRRRRGRGRQQEQEQEEQYQVQDTGAGAWAQHGARKKRKKQQQRDARGKAKEQKHLREKAQSQRTAKMELRWGTDKCTKALFLSGLSQEATNLDPRDLGMHLEELFHGAVEEEARTQATECGPQTNRGRKMTRLADAATAPTVTVQDKKTSGKQAGKVYAVATFKSVQDAQMAYDSTRRGSGLGFHGKSIWAKFTDEASARPRRPPTAE